MLGADSWQTTTFGTLLALEYGKALTERARSGDGYPVVGSAGVVGYHEEALISGPAIVVGRKGTAGSVVRIHSDCWPIDTTFYVRPLNDDISLEFLGLLLEASDLPGLVTATGVPGLNRNRVYEQSVVVPPASVRARIIDVVRSADDVVQAAQTHAETSLRTRAALLPALLLGEHEIPESYDRFLEGREDDDSTEESLAP